ncbi:hypothetical protein DL98DRAFT_518217 [Cadophora sp. DSE1049]|nr:hypothetical protein DL98DRAFT_518217 [Cadophora sp. DSE1049]
MQTRRSTKSTPNINIFKVSLPYIDDIDHPASPITSIDDSSSVHTATEHDQP